MQVSNAPILPVLPNCGICLDDIPLKDNRTLDCMHKFHADCIKKWINSSIHQQESAFHPPKAPAGCPECRHPIVQLNSNQAIQPALQIIVPVRPIQPSREAALAALMLPATALRYRPEEHAARLAQVEVQHVNNQARPSFLEFLASLLGKISR
jgi:hypothetical protein